MPDLFPLRGVVVVHRRAPAENKMADEKTGDDIDENSQEGDFGKDNDEIEQFVRNRRHGFLGNDNSLSFSRLGC